MTKLHPLQQRVLDFIDHHHLIQPGDRVLVAVSGGPDSVVLLHVLVTLQILLQTNKLTTLHLDHQLRGEASREDARFVQELTQLLGVPLHAGQADVLGFQRQRGGSLEMAARACRQRFFGEARSALRAHCIALGHTADDQAEEILLRLFRGTGPAGLAGMAVKSPDGLIRPLLFADRAEILDYLGDQGLSFRTDASNLDPCCQRNILRLKIFPLLRASFHPRQVRTLCRHAQLVRDEEDYWQGVIQAHWREVCSKESAEQIAINAERLALLPVALQRRLLRSAVQRLQGHLQRIYAVHIEAMRRLTAPAPALARFHPQRPLAASPSKGEGRRAVAVSGWPPDRREVLLPGRLRASRHGEFLLISRPPVAVPQPLASQILAAPGEYVFPSFSVRLQLVSVDPGVSGALPMAIDCADHAVLDAAVLCWPLVVRCWQPGDRFQPLGLKGSKKLQDFFTDAKIPREERPQIPLLCDQEKICWVVGRRLDERVKVTPATREVLVVAWKPG